MGLNKKVHKVSYRKVKHPRLELRTGELLVVLPHGHDPSIVLEKHKAWTQEKVDFIEACLKDSSNKTLVDRPEEDFRQLVARYAKRAARNLDVKVTRIFFRKMKTKWASCSARRNLTFNTLLKHLPDKLVQYVVFHEIAHIVEKKHNDLFWRMISKEFDDYRKLEGELFTYWFLIQAEQEAVSNQVAISRE